ncbi:MAG: MBL fold metallo-hydrolase [Planctomycetes bacterium]|nr:MBL fold metallo-hydrolase [Planctomycetota bacterium]
MHLQVLASGSEGNSTLVRCGETNLIVDAGLGRDDELARIDAAGVPIARIDHVLVTHGHLDHARSAGSVARRAKAMLHAPEAILRHHAAKKAPRQCALRIDQPFELSARDGIEEAPVRVASASLPHDCDPTVAFAVEHRGRRAVILTDLGHPARAVAERLANAHVLVLEFNWDPELMETGPYPHTLKKRITGDRGHLSNAQAATMLELLASEHLHTLVLAHLSKKTNSPERALEAAHGVLDRLGLASRVKVVVASQDEAGEAIAV